jgi:hypothetical protein
VPSQNNTAGIAPNSESTHKYNEVMKFLLIKALFLGSLEYAAHRTNLFT